MNKDYMLRMKPNAAGVSSPVKGGFANGRGGSDAAWEVRPGGMLVQKRNSDFNQYSNRVPKIKVRVKFGSSYHQVLISSQASFAELKKMVAEVTGVHTEDQKLIFKDKERDSKAFLDISGVKDGSKMMLIEDELKKQRRCVESRMNAKMVKASKEVSAIRFEVDNLAKQVASVELEISGGKIVAQTVLLNLIELLMTQLIKLDGIAADGDVKLQRRMQVKRVQKYIETLDILKIKNSGLGKAHLQHDIFSTKTFQKKQEIKKHGDFTEGVNPGPVVVTTKWVTF